MKDHVALVIKDENNNILFCRRSKLKKKLPLAWAFATGTCEENEDVFQTAKREAFEELGVEVKAIEVLCVKELPQFNDKLHFVVCEIISGEAYIKEPEEIEELLWLPLKEFFKQYSNDQIGHGLIYLRENPNLWSNLSK